MIKNNGITFVLYCTVIYWVYVIPVHANTYIEITGNDTTEFYYKEVKGEDRLTITLSAAERTEICEVDSNNHCIKWIYKDEKKNVQFTAIRKSDSIHIAGENNGEPIKHVVYVGNEPWLQFWEYGINHMLHKKNNKMIFYSIDANKPKRVALFIAANKGKESVKAGSITEKTSKVEVKIKGLPAMLFKAKLWFRNEDHTFLKSKMPKGPFVPKTIVEIKQ